MFESGRIGILGGIYNIRNGQVDFFKNLTRKPKKNLHQATGLSQPELINEIKQG